MQQYQAIKSQHKDYIVYEMFYEDAKDASQILGITLTKRAQKDEEIPMAGVPYHTCEHYIAKLVRAGKKIAICEQVETAQDKSSKIIDRQVVRIITPGTITDDALLISKRNNYLISLYSSGIMTFSAVFDLSTNEFFIQQFETHLLKDYLETIEPSEILIMQDFIPTFKEYATFKNIISLVPAITCTRATEKVFQFFQLNPSAVTYTNEEAIVIAMITDYIQMTQKLSFNTLGHPKRKHNNEQLHMDKFTRRNLEITKTLQNENYGSLIWLLDQTKTPQGGRALFKYINSPICNIEKLNKRLDKIEFFIKDSQSLSKVRSILNEIPDFERILSKISLNRSTPIQLRNLALGLKNFATLMKIVEFEKIDENLYPIALIEKILAAIEEFPEKEKWFIKGGVDRELDQWKSFEQEIDQQIEKLQEQYRDFAKLSNLRVKFHSNFGYLVEINSSQKSKLNYNFIFKQDLKNASRYTTQALEEISFKLAQSSEKILEKEKEIFETLCKEILNVSKQINEYAKISAKIDVFANFATIAMENGYVRPNLSQNNSFEVIAGRHPVLDKIMQNKGEIFVANDCDLSKCVMFMTGPNMAGKSTYLRQQTLIVLLAHIGMFVPAISANIGIVDQIFSRIGANDNLIDGNSTFMMEMIEISLTLNQATNKSFIVFDEVGRGTCVEEGMAIAQAVLEHLITNLRARTIFATHYLSLQQLEHINLQKKVMEIIEDPLHFTHKLKDGVAKKSYGLKVAQLAGMPSSIVLRAQELLIK